MLNISTTTAGYIPSFINASPTHLLIMTATIRGTIYINPPVNSNMITTRETERKKKEQNITKKSTKKGTKTITLFQNLGVCLAFFDVRSERIKVIPQ